MKDSVKTWIISPPPTAWQANPLVRGGPFGSFAIQDFGGQPYALSRPVKAP